MRKIPNAFQRQTLWTAITALSVTVIGALVVGLIWLVTRMIAFLQPLLIPFAVAGVLAYLLEPVVARLVKWGVRRALAVWLVFIMAIGAFTGFFFILYSQRDDFQKVPDYIASGWSFLKERSTELEKQAGKWNDELKAKFGVDLLHWGTTSTAPQEAPTPVLPDAAPSPTPNPAPVPPSHPPGTHPETTDTATVYTLQDLLSGDLVHTTLAKLPSALWGVISSSLGGFLGVFGFLVSMVIVPLYLYYFLTESPKIAQEWSKYVPLRASEFKDEVVGTLTAINSYLIAFFRGQLVVSIINGVATAVGLMVLGLKFGWLIGLALCFLGIVPYIGLGLCWIVAFSIASVQGGSWLVPYSGSWWVFPLIVTGVFALVQKIDSFFITPRVVGDRVGLHPMTVIASVFAWTLILGGLLGAILAVPLTAALKVLFQRYVWQRAVERRLQGPPGSPA